MCKKFFISIYHPESPYTVYCKDCFFSDAWDQYATGRDYDAEKSFFEQFRALDLEAPKMGTVGLNTENCDYTNYFGDSRNCYLTFAGTLNEDCLYGSGINNSKNALDSLGIKKNEWTYENVNSAQCHQAKYLELCFQCSESAFLFDCRSCQNCFMCTNLRQKKYHIHNQAYSPEEYKSRMQAIDFGSYETIEMLKKEFEILKRNTFHRNLKVDNNENVIGERVYSSKNCYQCFDLISCEDCRYCAYGAGGKDCMDMYALYPPTELCYWSFGLYHSYNVKWSILCAQSQDMEYCLVDEFSKHSFGCNNLHHSEYAILNKKYSPEDYTDLRKKVIEDMKARGEYGEFFPPELSPYAYNETVANEYFPLSKEAALEKGWRWIDASNTETQDLASVPLIPDQISDVGEDICKNTLGCVNCQKRYKIIQQELKFYKNMTIPIPRKCPDCRHKDRMALRNPRKLWERGCAKCGEEMKTSYSSERPEEIYCEKCYLKEVY